MNPIFKKLNFKDQSAIFVIDAPPSFQPVIEEMRASVAVHDKLTNAKAAVFALAFATRKSQVDQFADQIVKSANPDPVVWVAYPKGSSKNYQCEFNRDNGWDRMGAHGFEPVRMVAIDDDWSALRFRRVANIKTMTRRTTISQAGADKARKADKSS